MIIRLPLLKFRKFDNWIEFTLPKPYKYASWPLKSINKHWFLSLLLIKISTSFIRDHQFFNTNKNEIISEHFNNDISLHCCPNWNMQYNPEIHTIVSDFRGLLAVQLLKSYLLYFMKYMLNLNGRGIRNCVLI